uniref:Zinc finger protein 383-like n=1 Tax=Geotrypetes seraphini TaxID=260995 RepID=A0A6P8Q0E6_GEOSA|nr:zinc finger protein 383-like [Geotrypetes seraphini]
MPAGVCAQMQITFEDIAFSFSQEEWEYLDEEQKELYKEVMKENYQTLISLETGSPAAIPDIISHIERGEEPYIRGEPGSEERETGKSSCSADYEGIDPDILSRVRQEEDMTFWDPQESGEREVTHSYSGEGFPAVITDVVSHFEQGEEPGSEERETGSRSCSADRQFTQEREREKNQGEPPVEMEQIQRQSHNVFANISQRSERVNAKNCQQGSADQTHTAEDSLDGGPDSERNDSELIKIPEQQRDLSNNTDPISSKLHQEKGKEKKDQKEFADQQITQEREREKNQGEPPVEMEQIQRQSHNVFANISQRSERVNARNCQQGSADQTHTAEDSLDGGPDSERNDSELIKIPEQQRDLSNNTDPISSKLHQEKGKEKKDQKEFAGTVFSKGLSFSCNKCDKSFPLFSELEMHKRSHTNEAQVTCTECNKSFTRLSELKIHQRIHMGAKPYTCTECNKMFILLSNLKIHQMIHMRDKPYTCTECNKSFSRLSNLKVHERIHMRNKPYTCTECNKNFSRLSNLKDHQRIHTGDKPYACTECNKSFTQLSNLKSHQRIHTGDKPFTCSECNKSFTKLSCLKFHHRIHTGDKPYICTEYNQGFTQLSDLKRHQNIHTEDKAFTCTECNKSFTRVSGLKCHQRIHTGAKPYTCTECNKSFTQLSTLKTHQKSHTGVKAFTCTECNKSFTRLSNLKFHHRIHKGDRPHSCTEFNKSDPITSKLHQGKGNKDQKELVCTVFNRGISFSCNKCEKSFPLFSELELHKRSHAKEARLTCTECNKSFFWLSSLKRHQKTHTGN